MTLRTRWLAAFLAAVPAVLAQNAPHLAYVLPAGGRQGATFQVTTGGQFLPNVSKVYVSGSGVQATVVDYARPMNAMQATELRDRMQALQKQPMTAAVRKEMVDTRVKLLLFNARRLTSPVLAETVTLQVAIAPGAAPGKRELRVATPQGLSNPLVFCVGQLPEFTEKESISVVQPNANQPAQVQISQAPTDMRITLPATVNGRIKPGLPRPQARSGQPFTPGEADRYRFQAHQGQELVIAASARELIPYLADAVPGWFQAVLTLYDANGNELAYDDDYRFHPDPVIHYAVPKDGEYIDRDPGRPLSRARGFRVSHSHRRAAVCDQRLPAGRPRRLQDHRPAHRLEPPREQDDDECQRQSARRLSACQPRGFHGGHPARSLREGAQQLPRRRAARQASHHHERAHRSAGRLGCLPFPGPRRSGHRRRSLCAPARFPARFRAQADRRQGHATGVQRRLRRPGSGIGNAPRGFQNSDHSARQRNLLSLPGRRPTERRPGVRLSLAHRRATARFRSAGHAVEHQRQRRHDRSHHRPCPAQGWILRRHRAGVKGRSQRIHPDRRPAAGWPGRGAAHAHGSAAAPAGTSEPEPGRPRDHPGARGQPAGGSGGGHDAGFRLPPPGPRQ